MKTLIATMAIAALIAAPAFAQAPQTVPAPGGTNVVIGPGGKIIGDPDAFIRSEILRDISKPYR